MVTLNMVSALFEKVVTYYYPPAQTNLALTFSSSVIELLEVSSWRTLARLQAPELGPISVQGFTPDGTQLVVDAGGVRLWDLRRVREQLNTLGLDWDAPSLPTETHTPDLAPPRVEVQLGSFGKRSKNLLR